MIIFLTTKPINDGSTGGHQCTQRNYLSLVRIYGSENILVINIRDRFKDISVKDKLLKWVRLIIFCYYDGMTQRLLKKILKYNSEDNTFFFDGSLYGSVAKRIKRKKTKVKIITFFHNVEADFLKTKRTFKLWRYIKYLLVVKNEKHACSYSDIIIALNKRDAILLENKYKCSVDRIIPISLIDIYNTDRENRLECLTHNKKIQALFIGSNFPPNINGISWFVNNVLPKVQIKLRIIGKGMGILIDKFNDSNIEIIDFVEDLSFYIKEADFIVLPIFEGSGMKVKTCEALMFGKNIIGTSEAFCGYDIDFHGVGAICNTKMEFIEAINDFTINPRPKFNEYSRYIYLEKYSFDQTLKDFVIV